MISRELALQRTAGPSPRPTLAHSGSAARIIAELDDIAGKSRRRRRSGLHRALRRVGGAFTGWLDRLAPAVQPSSQAEPPEIRFPFF